MSFYKQILVALLVIHPFCALAEITKITVRDQKFEILKVLAEEKEIRKFVELWEEKKGKLTQRKILMRYKIDIEDSGRSTRWLYSEKGWTTVLSKTVNTQYQLEPEEINKILGILDDET